VTLTSPLTGLVDDVKGGDYSHSNFFESTS